MMDNVLTWLTRGESVRLDESFLMLFSNPASFHGDILQGMLASDRRSGLFRQALFRGCRVSYCPPLLGAPAVAMYTEAVARLGVKRIVACGYVGGIAPDLEIGSYVICSAAVGLDGCTAGYGMSGKQVAGSRSLSEQLGQLLARHSAKYGSGTVVSIDNLMIEDDDMIRDFSERGYAAVDLETACLFTLGELLDLEVAAFHIVSDHPERKKLDPERTHEASFSQQMEIALMGLTGFGRAS